MPAVVILLIVMLVLFAPFTVSASAFFDKDRKKLNLGIYMFSRIRILDISITPQKDGAEILLRKKRIFYPYKNLMKNKVDLNLFYGFNVSALTLLIESGSLTDRIIPIIISAVSVASGSVLFSIIKTYNPAIEAYNGVIIYENKDILRINANVSVLFNLALLAVMLIKIILEKFINGKRKSK